MRRLAILLLALAACQRSEITTVLPPDARIDVFSQLVAPQLDTLFVVDNSRFMSVIGPRIAQTFQSFTGYLDTNQIDYHLGLVSGDVSETGEVTYYGGGDKQYIASTDGGAAAAMAQAISALGSDGGDISAVLQQATLALQQPPTGFLRDGAALFIVLVTDNNDQWSPPGVQSPPYDDANLYYYRSYKQAKGPGNDGLVRFAVIAGPLPSGCSIPDPNNPSNTFVAQPAGRLIALATEMGGVSENLCDADFDTVFNQLGALGAGLKTVFRLSSAPDTTSLVVTVRAPCSVDASTLSACATVDNQCNDSSPALVCTPKQAATDGWTYDPTTLSILFEGAAIPPAGSEIDVQYKDPSQ